MTQRHLVVTLLALASGCSAGALEGAADLSGVDPVLGQTILFVGTDAQTLETNLYQVQAVDLSAGATSDVGGPDDGSVLDADEFEVTPLTSFRTDLNSPYQNEGDQVLPSQAPFAIPDRLGSRVAIVAAGYDPESGAALGRVAVLDLATGEQALAPDVLGLQNARFSWGGAYLILDVVDPESGEPQLRSLPLPLDGREPSPVGEGLASLSFAAHVHDFDAFYALSSSEQGATRVLRVDLQDGTVVDAVAPVEGTVSGLGVSPGGDLLAATVRASNGGRRSMAVASLNDAVPTLAPVGDGELDCSELAWSPVGEAGDVQRLAALCASASGRPDVVLWESGAGSSPPEVQELTGGAQTAVPDGSMDGLVLRSRLHWDQSGRVVVFGASNADDAWLDAPLTLLAVDIEEGRAIPIFDEDDGDADLAHFSSVAGSPVMLVWDRSASGLEDGNGRHPIRLVAADPAAPRRIRGIELGMNLLVSYPLFLGGNSLLYP